jgi:outer membrane receptor protein involved in Fe transport
MGCGASRGSLLRHFMPPLRRTTASRSWLAPIAGFAIACTSTFSRADNPAEVLELSQVKVIGTTPLPGSGVTLRRLPGNVQVLTSEDLRRQPTVTLTEFLEGSASRIGLNSA